MSDTTQLRADAVVVGSTQGNRVNVQTALEEVADQLDANDALIDAIKSDGSLITDLSLVTPTLSDKFLLSDASDSDNLAYCTADGIVDAAIVDEGGWTLNITPNAGTISSINELSKKHWPRGGLVNIEVEFTFTLSGSCHTIDIDLPVTAANTNATFSWLTNLSAEVYQCYLADTSTLRFRRHGGTGAMATGAGKDIKINGFYKPA